MKWLDWLVYMIFYNVSVPDKRCHAHFLALLAKDVTQKLGAFGKKCCVLTKAGFPELRAL